MIGKEETFLSRLPNTADPTALRIRITLKSNGELDVVRDVVAGSSVDPNLESTGFLLGKAKMVLDGAGKLHLNIKSKNQFFVPFDPTDGGEQPISQGGGLVASCDCIGTGGQCDVSMSGGGGKGPTYKCVASGCAPSGCKLKLEKTFQTLTAGLTVHVGGTGPNGNGISSIRLTDL